MYGWLFRHLPGPLWVRVLIILLTLAAIVVVLFGWVFPAIAPHLPFNDGLVGSTQLRDVTVPGGAGTA